MNEHKTTFTKSKFTLNDLEVGEYCSDVFLEAHVNHTIGLVHHQEAAHVERHHLLVQHVHQPPGRGNHDVHASDVRNNSVTKLPYQIGDWWVTGIRGFENAKMSLHGSCYVGSERKK